MRVVAVSPRRPLPSAAATAEEPSGQFASARRRQRIGVYDTPTAGRFRAEGVVEMPIAEVAVAPVGTDGASMSDVVASAREAVQRQGLKHQVTPMATVLEGSLVEIFDCARAMHEAALESGCPRVVTHITIDHRTDRPDSLERRVDGFAARDPVASLAGAGIETGV